MQLVTVIALTLAGRVSALNLRSTAEDLTKDGDNVRVLVHAKEHIDGEVAPLTLRLDEGMAEKTTPEIDPQMGIKDSDKVRDEGTGMAAKAIQGNMISHANSLAVEATQGTVKASPKSATEGISVKTRDQLPTFKEGFGYMARISLREVGIGYDKEAKQVAANMFSAYHSGIQVELNDGRAFVVELWDDGSQSLVPDKYEADGTPVWSDSMSIVYTDGLDEAHWGASGQSAEATVLAESVSAEELNALMEWVVGFRSNPFNRLYQFFTVWSSIDGQKFGGEERRQGIDNVCDTFTEAFYNELARVCQDKLNRNIQRIHRNYAPIISKSYDLRNPVLVDATDPLLKPFYEKLGQLGSGQATLQAVAGDWKGPFFIPARVGEPANYPSKYVKITDVQSIGTWFGLPVYTEQPLPAQFLAVCNKMGPTCDWWHPCAYAVQSGGHACDQGHCVCEGCAFQGRWMGKYCG